LIKHTNLDIKDAAFVNVAHILQHPTSPQITMSADNTTIDGLRDNLSPHPVGKSGKSITHSIEHHQQVT
jgi:hypothetical protein